MPSSTEKFSFELEAFSCSFKMGLSLTKQSMLPDEVFVSTGKLTILIPQFSVFTLESIVIINEMIEDLVSNAIQKYGEWQVLQNYLDDEGKEVREEIIQFYFQIEYCSTRFVSGGCNCHESSGIETKKLLKALSKRY